MLLQILDVLAAHFGLWVNSKTANKEFRWGGQRCAAFMNVVMLLYQSVNYLIVFFVYFVNFVHAPVKS